VLEKRLLPATDFAASANADGKADETAPFSEKWTRSAGNS
jgi:hypothetical protein